MSFIKNNNNKIPFTERISLVKNHRLFCLLTDKDIEQFALELNEQCVKPNDIIVKEGDILDNIYIIAEGRAEVIRKFSTSGNKLTKHIAYLQKGDIIGLTGTGFYSTSAIRTATVTALSPMILLTIKLSNLYFFLSNYPALRKTCEKFLLIKFIKETDLFADLKDDKIRQLIKQTTKITLPANKQLFSHTTPANKCYFILSGEMNITTLTDEGKESTQLLTVGAFLDETALHSSGSNTALVRAKTDCDLFQLEKAKIYHILQSHYPKKKSKIRFFWKKIPNFLKHIFKQGK